jgi:tRNA(fMet)-specific endonuclease VapC
MAMPVITLSELFQGAENSSRVSDNLLAIHYGAIRAALEKRGQVIGVNDLHIAAHARSEGLTVVTNNTDELARVPSLMVENWVG